jgi:hypothetical protein
MYPPRELPPMPKIAINENTKLLLGENYVGFSFNVGDVGFKFDSRRFF